MTVGRGFGSALRPDLAVAVATLACALGIAHVLTDERIAVFHAALLAAPLLLLVAIARPAWLVVALVAIPPGHAPVVGLTPGRIAPVLLVALAFHVAARRTLVSSWAFAPVVALYALTLFHAAVVAGDAAVAAATARELLLYYLALASLTYALVRTGELRLAMLSTAFVVGLAGTGFAYVWQSASAGTAWLAAGAGIAEPGMLSHRTHFGHAMALGFALCIPQALANLPNRRWYLGGALFFGALVFASFTRGAWVAVLVLLVAVPWLSGSRSYWLLAPLFAAVVVAVPAARGRLLGDLGGGLDYSVQSGQLGSNRVLLWRSLWEHVELPWGTGFGYAWTLTPESLFGAAGFVAGGNPFVYAHNDLLFWLLELGIVGAALYCVIWAIGVRATSRVVRDPEPQTRTWGIAATGALFAFGVASLVDNGFFIRAVGERGFLVLGAVLAAAAASSARRREVRQWPTSPS